MQNQSDLEKFWAQRSDLTIQQSLAAIEFWRNYFQLGLLALEDWESRLNDSPDIPTLQKAGTIFWGSVEGTKQSPLGACTKQFIDGLWFKRRDRP